MSNRLQYETSPYLLQHKENPVDWYPWCNEAFERAKREDKPIFLSIGYSACHWCHVLAKESFEDEEIAELLNKHFISVKVDKEERPDIDSVYMAVCQAFTGSGGWPTSIFMTAEKKPFFAGTYFPKTTRGRMIGMRELLISINRAWREERKALIEQAEEIISQITDTSARAKAPDIDIADFAARQYELIYDSKYGGFGHAPKFPSPHNILFLLEYYERNKRASCLEMAEHTLTQMYRGGIFDHIGFGFCRYSTDKKFLAPHFEKMLYDNALLIIAYCKAYSITKKDLYLKIAEKTAQYILDEMTSFQGGFFSSQDADSEHEEGKYYLLTPNEVIKELGAEIGEEFNRHFDITAEGNFEGKSIPNLLKSDFSDMKFEPFLSRLKDYRKKRYSLHRDEKILTSWNSLLIAAMCRLYLVSRKSAYLDAAKNADRFIQKKLFDGDELYVSFHMERRGARGFLDDYASYIFAKLSLYRATLEKRHLDCACNLCDKVIRDFSDNTGGFYLYGDYHEELILRPKESYDGAIPSANSLMAYNLVLLSSLTGEQKYGLITERQLDFLKKEASQYPTGHAMFLCALLERERPSLKLTVVGANGDDIKEVVFELSDSATIILRENPDSEYPLINGKTSYYLCRAHSCLPPTNDLNEILKT